MNFQCILYHKTCIVHHFMMKGILIKNNNFMFVYLPLIVVPTFVLFVSTCVLKLMSRYFIKIYRLNKIKEVLII